MSAHEKPPRGARTEHPVDKPDIQGRQSNDVLRSDVALYAGSLTWVDAEYDERLADALANLPEITLPIGTSYVTVGEIPRLIAAALYPESRGERTVSYLRKAPPGCNRTEPLSPEDWEYLNKIAWQQLPPYEDGLSESSWQAYAEAFNSAPGKPDWQLVPLERDGPLSTAMLREDAERLHKKEFEGAILRGKLKAYTHAMTPMSPSEGTMPQARIRVDDFADYVKAFARLRIESVQPASNGGLSNPKLEATAINNYVGAPRSKGSSAPVITPLPTGNAMPSVRDEPSEPRRPNWGKWKLIPDVRIWEGVALSLDIDPDKVRHNPQSWMAGKHLFDESEEFKDRIEIASRNLGSRGSLTAVSLSMDDSANSRVSLIQFAAWADSRWEIPEELKMLARAGNAQPPFDEVQRAIWARKDAWKFREIIFLLCGRIPDMTAPDDEELNQAADSLKRAVIAHALQYIGEPTTDERFRYLQLFRPRDVIVWASDRFPKFPLSLQDLPSSTRTDVTDYLNGRILLQVKQRIAQEIARRRNQNNAMSDAAAGALTEVQSFITDLLENNVPAAKEIESLENGAAECFELRDRCAKLQQQIDELQAQPVHDAEDLEPGERKTLCTLGAYFGRKHAYDPAAMKTDATGKIQRELESQGLTLDGKTIRKLLKLGAERFPDKRSK